MKKKTSTCLEGVERGRQRLVEEDEEGIVVKGTLGRRPLRMGDLIGRGEQSGGHPGEHRPRLGSCNVFRWFRSSERVGRRGRLEVLFAVRS